MAHACNGAGITAWYDLLAAEIAQGMTEDEQHPFHAEQVAASQAAHQGHQ